MEFDEERLAPTYRLLWGLPGRSNALHIAHRLGLPAAVIHSAQQEMGQQAEQVNEVSLRLCSSHGPYDDGVRGMLGRST